MIQKETFTSVELFQQKLENENKGIILMVSHSQSDSVRKFLKFPS